MAVLDPVEDVSVQEAVIFVGAIVKEQKVFYTSIICDRENFVRCCITLYPISFVVAIVEYDWLVWFWEFPVVGLYNK